MVISEIRWSRLSRWLLAAALALELGVVAVMLWRTPAGPTALPILVLTFAVVFLLLRLVQTVRVAVEGMELTVGFPIFRRRIPLHSIDEVTPVHYRWYQWGGWGIRYRRGAVLYNVPGDRGRAVELKLKDGKKVLFSAEDPDQVCVAIRAQRAAMPY